MATFIKFTTWLFDSAIKVTCDCKNFRWYSRASNSYFLLDEEYNNFVSSNYFIFFNRTSQLDDKRHVSNFSRQLGDLMHASLILATRYRTRGLLNVGLDRQPQFPLFFSNFSPTCDSTKILNKCMLAMTIHHSIVSEKRK